MGNIFQVGDDRHLLLYTLNNNVILRSINKNNMAKPIYLCNDFGSNLTCTIHNASIFFSYVNLTNDIIVRNTSDNTPVRTITMLSDSYKPSPTITSFNGHLALIYISYDPYDDSYFLKCSFPDTSFNEINISNKIKQPPQYNVMTCEKYLYVYAHHLQTYGIVQVNDKEAPVRLFTQNEANIIAAEKYHKALDEKNSIIESIKLQYSQLMDTANAYRNEMMRLQAKLSETK